MVQNLTVKGSVKACYLPKSHHRCPSLYSIHYRQHDASFSIWPYLPITSFRYIIAKYNTSLLCPITAPHNFLPYITSNTMLSNYHVPSPLSCTSSHTLPPTECFLPDTSHHFPIIHSPLTRYFLLTMSQYYCPSRPHHTLPPSHCFLTYSKHHTNY